MNDRVVQLRSASRPCFEPGESVSAAKGGTIMEPREIDPRPMALAEWPRRVVAR